MKCVILAGGRGARISELTKNIPKPMIIISGKPILYHIMKHYSNYGVKDFIVAAGYKKNMKCVILAGGLAEVKVAIFLCFL